MDNINQNFEKAVFISDVHLGSGMDDKEREDKLLDFLNNEINEKTVLLIIGDLFDFWFEYKTVTPKGYYRLFSKLIDMIRQGTLIYYIAGNHDFWVGEFFNNEIGIKFHPEPVEIEIFKKKIYITHGDGLKKNDWGYRLLKKIFRNRLNIFLYRWIHPDIGVPLAKKMSKTSRDYTSNRDYGSDEEYFDFAKKKMDEGFDAVVLAHTHRPDLKHLNDKYYINVGDWIEHFSYLTITSEKVKLEYWKK